MDAFEDGFSGEAEVDPAAEFLAKEQEELGDIGEGFQEVQNWIPQTTQWFLNGIPEVDKWIL